MAARAAFAAALDQGAERLVETHVRTGRVPHLHVMLSLDGELVLDRCAGIARESGEALQPDALYRIASMSKPVAVAAFLSLVERGLVGLDQPLADWVPEMAAPQVWTGEQDAAGSLRTRPARRPILMRDLLGHSAGLSYGFNRQTPVDALYEAADLDNFHRRRTSDEFVATLASMPLLHEPGERFCYSLAIDLLGVVMERVTGDPLDILLERRIFAPLGMMDSGFRISPDKEARLTDAWMVHHGNGKRTPYDRGAKSRWHKRWRSVSAGGGLLSSVADYHRFLRMLLAGGKIDGGGGRTERLLMPESIALMLRNQLPGGGDLAKDACFPFSETSASGVGMGWGGAVLLDPERAEEKGAPGSFYWGGILSTGFFLDPARRLAGIVMTQLMPSSATRVREEFRAMAEEVWLKTYGRRSGE